MFVDLEWWLFNKNVIHDSELLENPQHSRDNEGSGGKMMTSFGRGRDKRGGGGGRGRRGGEDSEDDDTDDL